MKIKYNLHSLELSISKDVEGPHGVKADLELSGGAVAETADAELRRVRDGETCPPSASTAGVLAAGLIAATAYSYKQGWLTLPRIITVRGRPLEGWSFADLAAEAELGGEDR